MTALAVAATTCGWGNCPDCPPDERPCRTCHATEHECPGPPARCCETCSHWQPLPHPTDDTDGDPR